MKNEVEISRSSVNYLLYEFKDDNLFPVILREYCCYMGRNLLKADLNYKGGEIIEKEYYLIIANWLKGKSSENSLNDEFYRQYSFFNVPDFILYSIDEKGLLKENHNKIQELYGRLTVLYYLYLKGEGNKATKLFYFILRNYRQTLTVKYRRA